MPDRRLELSREFSVIDELPPKLRAVLNYNVSFTTEQIGRINSIYSEFGEGATIAWIESLLDKQYPEWRGWK